MQLYLEEHEFQKNLSVTTFFCFKIAKTTFGSSAPRIENSSNFSVDASSQGNVNAQRCSYLTNLEITLNEQYFFAVLGCH